jgi:hypothetical protein
MESDYEKAQFIQLILGLQSSAWILLGKIMNPMTGKIERNLEHAKLTIDTLQMLKNKTKGNLAKDEENILNTILTELQLNYVDEAGKPTFEDKPSSQDKVNEDAKDIKSEEK